MAMERFLAGAAGLALVFAILPAAQASRLQGSGGEQPRIIDHLRFDRPELPPIGHTRLCADSPDECAAGPGTAFDSRADAGELAKVNAAVNTMIAPEANDAGLAGETWSILPVRGDCNDYAVSKRHELIARGWSPSALLLAEVVLRSGQHHLVLVARLRHRDVVLDNLSPAMLPWSRVPYRWARIQSPRDPRYWVALERHRRNDMLLAETATPAHDERPLARDDGESHGSRLAALMPVEQAVVPAIRPDVPDEIEPDGREADAAEDMIGGG